MRLNDRVALVTGGGRGIGRAIARAFAGEGANVAVCARTEGQVKDAAAEIEALGVRSVAIPGDVSDEDDVARIVAETRRVLGPIDVLVNNAGIFRTRLALETDPAEFDAIMRTNVRGPFLMTRAVAPEMLERAGGVILNIGSLAGKKGYVAQSAYCASKHALLGFSRALAMELEGSGVRVSVLSPGGVDTELIVAERPDVDRATWMEPEDIARLAVLLVTMPDKMAVDEIAVRRTASSPVFF